MRAIANSKIPIISAIGHETDFSLADFAADLRAPTPTAAAEFITQNRKELQAQQNRILQKITGLIEQHLLTITYVVQQLYSRFAYYTYRLQSYSHTIGNVMLRVNNSVQNVFRHKEMQLRITYDVIKALNPESVLKRGYALIQKNDAYISSVYNVNTDDILTIQMHDGQFGVKVQTAAEDIGE